ncbi:GNAT family N-acetyltransferase [Legionella israelensis]|uniref:GNAT family N-acetyltransferase n=1 Tax=Legionella israelensis TaxID=454 RepID=A0AAX1EHL6_9GAMM|nr:GNAT family N-acetyltransferase [Legionella israelensis]QBR84465.1 GNAT family N-acetyltransferase [Legionella israelensis]
MTYPYIRRAEEKDYPAIHSIWMQDHIIQWMSFRKQSLEEFRSRYVELSKHSDIYVMVDEIKGKERVVGVRRIKYLSGDHSHIAELCSMGVDVSLQGKGYGGKFYDEFEKIIKENKKIKRIQLTQSGGNFRAFSIAEKKGYSEEAMFPDWLEREGQKGSHYFLIERYICKIIDNELEEKIALLPYLSYNAKLPSLTTSALEKGFSVQSENNQIIVKLGGTLILTTEFYPDTTVIQHIGFLENIRLHSDNKQQCLQAMRQAINFIAKEGNVKKLELFVSDPKIISLCQESGFWVRGECRGSLYHNGEYYNELGVEYSFFGIDEAREVLKSFEQHQLEKLVINCQKEIQKSLEQGLCDELGACYMENIVYQVVRDELDKLKIMSLENKPWNSVIKDCPETVRTALIQLIDELNSIKKSQKTFRSGFFQPVTGSDMARSGGKNSCIVHKQTKADFSNF